MRRTNSHLVPGKKKSKSVGQLVKDLRPIRTDFGHLLGKYCVLTVTGPDKLFEYAPDQFHTVNEPFDVMGRVVGRESVGIWFEPAKAVVEPNKDGRIIPYHMLVRWEFIQTATTNPLVNDIHHDSPDWQGLKPRRD